MLYVDSGYAQWGGLSGNVLLAFEVGVPERSEGVRSDRPAEGRRIAARSPPSEDRSRVEGAAIEFGEFGVIDSPKPIPERSRRAAGRPSSPATSAPAKARSVVVDDDDDVPTVLFLDPTSTSLGQPGECVLQHVSEHLVDILLLAGDREFGWNVVDEGSCLSAFTLPRMRARSVTRDATAVRLRPVRRARRIGLVLVDGGMRRGR